MKKSICLLLCLITLICISGLAQNRYGFGNCTFSFKSYYSNHNQINSPFSITFSDPDIFVTINGKKYTYSVYSLTRLTEENFYTFYTSNDKESYIQFYGKQEQDFLIIKTPEICLESKFYNCNEPSKLFSFLKDVDNLFKPQVKITGYYFPVFTDQQIILAYRYKIINGKNRKFRRILTINDDDNSNVVGSIDPEDIIIVPESNNEEETIREPMYLTDYEFRSYERPGVMGLSNGRHLLDIRLSIVDKEHPNIGDQVVVDIPVVVENGKVKNVTHREWNW